jgi:outer membrane biosynthesis protein TonB
MAPSRRTLLHWLLIPGLSLGLFLLLALGAAWVTRIFEAPPQEPVELPAPPMPPRPAPAPAPPPSEPPRTTAPLTPPPAPPRESLSPPRLSTPNAADPRRVALVEPQVESSSGRIDAEDLRLALKAVTPLVQQCFQDAAQRNRGAHEVKLRFTVEGEGSEGRMNRGELVSSTIPDPLVQACVLDSLLDARFPAPHLGGSATVVYPFRFSVPGEAGP